MFFFHRRDAEHAEFTVFMFSVERTENIKTMLLKISQIQGKPEKMVFKRHKAIAFPLLLLASRSVMRGLSAAKEKPSLSALSASLR